MSLLLDALKKAADDKQKVAKDNAINSAPDDLAIQDSDERKVFAATENIVESISESDLFESNGESPAEDELSLVLDDLDELVADENGVSEAVDESMPVAAKPVESAAEADTETARENRYQVSDEALSLLISKTNREVKLGKRLAVISSLVIASLIMLSGGAYYYQVTQDDIASLERKHRLTLQAMKAKISGEKDPDNVEVIRNLVSDTALEEKVEFVKKQIAEKNKLKQADAVNTVAKQKDKKSAAVLSIQKTNKTDPVEEKLDAAWLAYDAGNYADAKRNYEEVLTKEKNNRDALLGLGAIAIRENDNAKASEYYLALLEQDPRDPIATAALSSLHYDDTALELHEKHLLSILEKSPDAAPLIFALGNVYAQQEKWKAAQQAYFDAWQQDSGNANYLFNLAVSMDQLGKHEQATEFYKRCLQQSTNDQTSFSREAVTKRINELSGL